MSEWEVIDSLDRLQLDVIAESLMFLILQNLVGRDKGVCLVHLVLLLVSPLLVHLLTLVVEKVLLVVSLLELAVQLTVLLLVDLVNDLAKKVVVVRSVEVHLFVETVSHFAVDETLQVGVRDVVDLQRMG